MCLTPLAKLQLDAQYLARADGDALVGDIERTVRANGNRSEVASAR